MLPSPTKPSVILAKLTFHQTDYRGYLKTVCAIRGLKVYCTTISFANRMDRGVIQCSLADRNGENKIEEVSL